MKVTGSGPIASQNARRSATTAGGFSVATGTGQARATGPAMATTGVASVAALLALQEDDGPETRRRKALKRGGGLLDCLEAVKLALLEGGDGSVALSALSRLAAEERQGDPDPALQDVLDHIETRAAVELAKARVRRAA
ncbi:MAG: flagellar assembly protein FliX [Caulobacterales bacterium]|nr:flagellar assembly protein FliX [Caulobacterales bacterium]